ASSAGAPGGARSPGGARGSTCRSLRGARARRTRGTARRTGDRGRGRRARSRSPPRWRPWGGPWSAGRRWRGRERKQLSRAMRGSRAIAAIEPPRTGSSIDVGGSSLPPTPPNYVVESLGGRELVEEEVVHHGAGVPLREGLAARVRRVD